jgi:heme a synthase
MNSENKLKKYWLFGFCVLVILMISVGGITRLTRSGLSIVEWKPISGIIPPITETDWQNQFELYKQTPEYQKINSHFELSDYKQIFIWEYLHRVLGRIIFLFVLIPGIYFWRKKLISGKFVFGLAAFIAFQGLIGWLMVKTGLNVKPHVSPFMLALHFFLALGALHIAAYQYFKLTPAFQKPLSDSPKSFYKLFGVFLGLQVFWGCLVGGLKAGIGFNTYPLMNGNFFPEGGMFLTPVWLNFLENPGTVQWVHRWLGIATGLVLIAAVIKLKKSEFWSEYKNSALLLVALVVLQIALGILTIIYVVPIHLAATHQFVAALLVLAYFKVWFQQPNLQKV